MRHLRKNMFRLSAVALVFALVAAACGDDEDEAPAPAAEPAEAAPAEPAEAPADDADDMADEPVADDMADEAVADDMADEPVADDMADEAVADDMADEAVADDMAGGAADDSLPAVKIGMIAQEEELIAFPEMRAAAEAVVAYFNAELGGIDGHPVEIDICGAGDGPESHLACAQRFVNDDDIHIVVNGGIGTNTGASGAVMAEAGLASMPLGNDFGEYLTPGVYTFEPGIPGLSQVLFVYSAAGGATSATLFLYDDPSVEVFVPAFQAIAADNGIDMNQHIPVGFEPDLTGPISAADMSNDVWMFVLADGAQCQAAANAAKLIGYDGPILTLDSCMQVDVLATGDLDGWVAPMVSSAPTIDGGADVEVINHIFDTYGSADAHGAGLGGWALGNVMIAREVLIAAGGADATDESVIATLDSGFTSNTILGFPEVSCPGPAPWIGACNTAPLMVTVDGTDLTAPDGFFPLDFTELNFLLEG